MNAAETIAAAIEKLEAWRALAWPCEVWTQSAVRHIARNCEIECYDEDHDGVDGWDRYETGPAIYGLSRTIDAQLAILRTVYDARLIEHNWGSLVYTENAFVLAKVILGES